MHCTFKAPSSPDLHLELAGPPESLPPSPSLRLREALQVTFIDIQTPQAPMVLFPQPTRWVIKAPSSIYHHLDWALALDLYLGCNLEIHREIFQVICPLPYLPPNWIRGTLSAELSPALPEPHEVSPERPAQARERKQYRLCIN